MKSGIAKRRTGVASRARLSELIDAAITASGRAYCPYSGFPVGAALRTTSGKVFTGCNVENASFGMTNCAERNAVFSAVAAGEKEFDTMVIYTPMREMTGPCGACRQVMAEFSPKMKVVLVNRTGRVRTFRLDRLLPARFSF